VYEMSAQSVRQFLNTRLDLADIILQAFIARRRLLRESEDFTGLRVIGSRWTSRGVTASKVAVSTTLRRPMKPSCAMGRM
jgi:hypothetical protein